MELNKLQEYISIKKLLDEKDWWTVEELAIYLDKDVRTIRNYISGHDPKINLSKCSKKINGTLYIIKDLFKTEFAKIETIS